MVVFVIQVEYESVGYLPLQMLDYRVIRSVLPGYLFCNRFFLWFCAFLRCYRLP